MDIDAMGKHLNGLLEFKAKIEAMIDGKAPDAEGNSPTAKLEELLAFKSEVEGALPDIRKAIADADALAGDVAKLREEFAPVIAWVEEHQKAAAEKPAEAKPDPDKPLDHLAEIEAKLDVAAEPAAETEQSPA